MHTPEQALNATKDGIIRCLLKKNDPRYQGIFYLLIQAHLSTLPKERWGAIMEELSQEAINLPFQEVYVIGNTDKEPWGVQVK